MNAQKIAKFIWEELVAFLIWVAPALWNIFADNKTKKEDIRVTGVIQTEDGYFLTTYSDGTTESGSPGIKGPFV